MPKLSKGTVSTNEFFFIDKPHDFSTHAVDVGHPGVLDYMEADRGQKLWPVHRLDRVTTGCLLLATSAEAAEKARVWFTENQVQKKYLFVTDRKVDFSEETVLSLIENDGESWISKPSETPNAETRFTRLKEFEKYSLWQAEPKTGKTHQIRLHANGLGIPILGDVTYDGSPFVAPLLHCQEMILPNQFSGVAVTPRLMQDLTLFKNPRLARWILAIERRERMLRSLKNQPNAYRLMHDDDSSLQVDKLGEIYWFHQFNEGVSSTDLEELKNLFQIKNWVLQERGNRGKAPASNKLELSSEQLPLRWQINENGRVFELRRDQGSSSGLFLDQRHNRDYIQAQAKEKSVLNLFAYTGGFSVAAAKGGAQKVDTVDVSPPYLDWTRKNFELNNLISDGAGFYARDAIKFLATAKKKDFNYDLIVCDPPSFGRSKDSVFRLQKDWPELFAGMCEVLNPEGQILFCFNLEIWNELDTKKLLDLAKRYGLKRLSSPISAWDFEAPGEKFTTLKTFLFA